MTVSPTVTVPIGHMSHRCVTLHSSVFSHTRQRPRRACRAAPGRPTGGRPISTLQNGPLNLVHAPRVCSRYTLKVGNLTERRVWGPARLYPSGSHGDMGNCRKPPPGEGARRGGRGQRSGSLAAPLHPARRRCTPCRGPRRCCSDDSRGTRSERGLGELERRRRRWQPW